MKKFAQLMLYALNSCLANLSEKPNLKNPVIWGEAALHLTQHKI